MKEILCFGDSNTYGLIPGTTRRYDREARWTGILAEKLYDKGYRIIEEGLCGRTSVFDDATRDGRNGAKVLPMLLETHTPLDQVVLMLGTNDCKTYNHASADRIGKGIEKLIQQIRKAQEGEFDMADYMPSTKKDIDGMFKELLAMISKTKNQYLKQLAEKIFIEDKNFAREFKVHSAAKSVHHGYIGGLLEHSLSVAKICESYASLYPQLNRDLIVMCALWHDMGKVEELSSFPENDYTDEGQLVGHIVMGAIKLDRLIREIPGFPPKLANEVKHCMLAHHGELEFGSPKKPALLEAIALSQADNLDAKMETFAEIMEKQKEDQEWSGFQRLLDTRIRKTSI